MTNPYGRDLKLIIAMGIGGGILVIIILVAGFSLSNGFFKRPEPTPVDDYKAIVVSMDQCVDSISSSSNEIGTLYRQCWNHAKLVSNKVSRK